MLGCLPILLLLILFFSALLITRKGFKKLSSEISQFGWWGMFVFLQNAGNRLSWGQEAGGTAATSRRAQLTSCDVSRSQA